MSGAAPAQPQPQPQPEPPERALARRLPRLRDRVYRAPSAIHGQGVFARAPIAAGQYIGTYEGPPVRRDGTYVLWVYGAPDSPPEGRSGRNLLRWLNHQDDGNAEFDGFDLYARRDIAIDEEITFDYSGGQGRSEPATPAG